jgi:hypothetical protein
MYERVEHFLDTTIAENIKKIVNYSVAIVFNIHDDIKWKVLSGMIID